MKIWKSTDHLVSESRLNFGYENCMFCGMPYVHLIAFKEGNAFWSSNMIGIAVHDCDDLDLGLIYHTDSEHFFDVLHELINWMYDHECGINRFDSLWGNIFDFFPDLGCKRKYW